MPDQDGYPTDDELQRIRDWSLASGAQNWFASIKLLWHFGDWGWREEVDEKGTRTYHISTGGWSGNESIIEAMRGNEPLWSLTWMQSRLGGHYIFEAGVTGA